MTQDVTQDTDQPMETAHSSAVYVWQHATTGVRYALHIPDAGAPLDTSTLRNSTIIIVQSLTSLEHPIVLVHYQPQSNQLELSIPHVGRDADVKELASSVERGPQPVLRTLINLFDADPDTIHVEHIEIRYNDVADLSDSSRFAILHTATAHLPVERAPGLVEFFRMLKQVLPAA